MKSLIIVNTLVFGVQVQPNVVVECDTVPCKTLFSPSGLSLDFLVFLIFFSGGGAQIVVLKGNSVITLGGLRAIWDTRY